MKTLRGIAVIAILGYVAVAGVATWFGWPVFQKKVLHKEAAKVEQAQKKEDAAKEQITQAEKAIVADAHADVKATGMALEDGRVDVAKSFNTRADTKLTAVTGGVPLEEVNKLRDLVTRLESENAAVKAQASQELARRDQRSEELSKDLGKAQAALETAQKQLREATNKLQEGYAREEELADKYRWLMRYFWGAVIAAVAFLGFGLYTRIFTVGGILGRIGTAVHEMGDKAKDFVPILDANLDKWHQDKVNKARKVEALK